VEGERVEGLVREFLRIPLEAGADTLVLACTHYPFVRPVIERFAGPHVHAPGLPEELAALGYDAQTAGGLLVSLPAEKGAVLEAAFAARGLFLRRIGAVEAGTGVLVD
jgi:hypothetical protein